MSAKRCYIHQTVLNYYDGRCRECEGEENRKRAREKHADSNQLALATDSTFEREHMTGDELKQIRTDHCLSLAQMSQFCGVSNTDNLRYMETGKKPVSGPIAVLAEAMRRGLFDSWLDEIFGPIRESQS